MSELIRKITSDPVAYIIKGLSMIAIIIICAIVLTGAGYTYLCEDDFSFETGVMIGSAQYHSAFVGALMSTIEYCKMWQGTYLSVFLYFFIGPYVRWGIQGFHLAMIILSLLFIMSLLYAVCSLVKDSTLRLVISALSLLAVFEMNGSIVDQELFLWYTGALNYTLVLALSFIGAGLTIRLFREDHGEAGKRKAYLTGASVICFFASLGCLEISACNCAFILGITVLNAESALKKGGRYKLIPFITALFGAILNVLCPGNFSKSDMWTSDQHSSFADAIVDSVRCHYQESVVILKSPVFILVLCLALTAGVMFNVRIRKNGMNTLYLVIMAVGIYLIQFCTMFPVLLGYHSSELSSYRTKATYEIVARLMYILFVLCISQWICEKGFKYSKAAAGAVLLVGVLACIIFSSAAASDIKDGFAYRIAYDHHVGNLQKNYSARSYVISSMEIAPKGTDLEIEVPLSMIESESMYGMGLGDDPDWIVNVSAATLFDLGSVKVNYK